MDSKRVGLLRLLLLALLLAGLFALGAATGLRERLSIAWLRTATESAGVAGVLIYVAAFSVGELMQVPGLVFVAAAILIYGRLWGGSLAFVSALISVSITFFVVRGVGGRPLGAVERPLMKRILARLDGSPIRTVLLLRLVFLVSPPLNYALALSPLRYRDYLVGSAAGLVLPISVAAVFFDRLLRYLTPSP